MSLSVAIVDDDPHFRSSVAHVVLSAHDMRFVGAADDIAPGRALIDASRPDVLLVDLSLPSGSGLELIRYARFSTWWSRTRHCAAR